MNEDVPILPALLALPAVAYLGFEIEADSAKSSICSTRKRA
jgi:hypothetical protein